MATDSGICRVMFPGDPELSTGHGTRRHPASSSLTEAAAEMISAYFRGEKTTFLALPVDLERSTPFRSNILRMIRSIRYGEVKSYGEIAAMAGIPAASRAVGGAMASNPVPLVIPCHRVIAADGSLTGFSAAGGILFKKYLLMLEGIEFKGDKVLRK